MKKLKHYAYCVAGVAVFALLSLVYLWQWIRLRRSNDLASDAVELALNENKKLRKKAIKERLVAAKKASSAAVIAAERELSERVANDDRSLADVVNDMHADS